MSGIRLMFWSVTMLATAGALLSGLIVADRATSPSSPRIVFVTAGSTPFWQQAVRGAEAAARVHSAELEIAMPDDDDLQQQVDMLNTIDVSQLDGVALSPIARLDQTEIIDRISRRTNVMTVGLDAPQSKRISFVGAGGFAVGRLAANVVGEATPDGGKVAILVANDADEVSAAVIEGFSQAIKESLMTAAAKRIEVIECKWDCQDNQSCAENIRKTVAAHTDLDCFVALNGAHAATLTRVLREADQLKQIKVVAYDQSDATLAAIEAGEIHAAIALDPYILGYRAISRLAAICNYNALGMPIAGKGSSFLPAQIVRKENLAEFRALSQSQSRVPPDC